MDFFLYGVLLMTFLMVAAKRISSLITGFALQSFFLFLLTFTAAFVHRSVELYVVSGLILAVKVLLVPYFLNRIAKRINVAEQLGLLINPMLSLFCAMALTYSAYLFAGRMLSLHGTEQASAFVVSLSVTLIGLFLMIFRLKALTQIVGLLTMENGLFLAAVAMCGGMPFFVEIAIFFDVFVCVIILGIFVYRINQLFTHIDVDKLRILKG
ncbi:MAG: hydrogenase [Endomicrobiales bacterium]